MPSIRESFRGLWDWLERVHTLIWLRDVLGVSGMIGAAFAWIGHLLHVSHDLVIALGVFFVSFLLLAVPRILPWFQQKGIFSRSPQPEELIRALRRVRPGAANDIRPKLIGKRITWLLKFNRADLEEPPGKVRVLLHILGHEGELDGGCVCTVSGNEFHDLNDPEPGDPIKVIGTLEGFQMGIHIGNAHLKRLATIC